MSTEEVLIIRTEEEQKRAVEIHDSFKNELLKRQLSNTENYDKSILTLSSSALAISLTFFNNIANVMPVKHLWLLKTSWGFFLLSILVSIFAYLVSNSAITKQLELAHDYYINKKQSAMNKKNWLSILNNFLNIAVGIFFAVAITSTTLFVTTNLKQGEKLMSIDKTKSSTSGEQLIKSATVPGMQQAPSSVSHAFDSALVPKMSAAPGVEISINSAQVPTMQAAPGVSSVSQQQQTTQQAQATDTKK